MQVSATIVVLLLFHLREMAVSLHVYSAIHTIQCVQDRSVTWKGLPW